MTTENNVPESGLRPCPFCGLSLMVVYNPATDESSITCSDSESCVSVSALGLKNLNRVWNTRPIEERLIQERDEARLEAKAATEVAVGYFLEYRKYDRKWGLAVVSAEKQRLIYEWKKEEGEMEK